MLSHGVPMLLMGDEYGATKGGNNSAYCHDSPLNYLDWGVAEADEHGFARFMRRLIHLRCGLQGARARECIGVMLSAGGGQSATAGAVRHLLDTCGCTTLVCGTSRQDCNHLGD